jgi:hypothetical protein
MSQPITQTQTLHLTGRIAPDQTWTYIDVPFEVPAGVGRLDVVYRYDAMIGSDPHLTGGNTLDIGIFDARGSGFSSPGYRGWTGSARDRFFISPTEATPGYMPGPIQPGTWHVILGAYKVAANGCGYEIDVTFTPGPGDSATFPPLLALTDTPKGTYASGAWLRGELHCHTTNSDGDSSVEEVVHLCEGLGLDFLAVMDHNNITQRIDLATVETPLLLIPGYEVTMYYGHWNVWGDQGWIDFRVTSADDLARSIAEATARGFLVSCNHPKPYGPDWAFPQVEGYACVEVWNGPWPANNTASLAFWTQRLDAGQRLVAVGGSDSHFHHKPHPAQLGQPCMFILPDGRRSPQGVLDGLRQGHAFISESPDGPQLRLTSGDAIMGDSVSRPADNQLPVSVEVIGGSGAVLELHTRGNVERIPVEIDNQVITRIVDVSDTPYVRAQLVDPASGHVRALTNPIYVE